MHEPTRHVYRCAFFGVVALCVTPSGPVWQCAVVRPTPSLTPVVSSAVQLAQQQHELGKHSAIVLLAEQPKEVLEEEVGSLRSETGADIMVRTGLPYNLADLKLVAAAAAATIIIMIPPLRVRRHLAGVPHLSVSRCTPMHAQA